MNFNDYFNFDESVNFDYNSFFEKINSIKSEHIFTVNEITSIIQNIIENYTFSNILVSGEISNISKSSSGHIYFSLKDESKSLLRCVLFRHHLININFNFKDGDKVICKGDISVYKPNSEFNLKVKNIRKEGIGELFQKFEELKEKLKAKGLFDQANKKQIPLYPFNIGIITAETGAVVNDIVKTLKRRAPFINIYIFPCLVQGEEASKSIINAIRNANTFSDKIQNLDLIIIARGGGSIEDLWCFNEEPVAYEIFNSKIPTISAIGHETDFTISDFVADLRASTPTAAAEIISNNFITIKEFLSESHYTLIKELIKLINLKKSKIDPNKNILLLSNYLSKKIDKFSYDLLFFENKIINLFNQKLINYKKKVEYNQSILEALSPENILKRGFVIIKKDNKIITSSKELLSRDKILINFYDGKKEATIN
ncbi:MAG: exodeoxyribonuclease VII large subunit [Spirochaetes bacterium]|nr:exodeoxyribonuclease VII large subunit [Spirochaetota bacterium]